MAHHFGIRPSELMQSDAASFGFDLAVFVTAIQAKPKHPKDVKPMPTALPPDPIDYFDRMGQKGWNAGRH